MADKTEHDQFDDLAPGLERRGVHRAPARRGAGWIKFAWAALATGVLVVAGVGTLIVTSDSISMKDFESIFAVPVASATPTPKATAAPTVDPASLVSIINATGETGMATQAGDALTAEGWTVAAKTNSETVVEETMVYYVNPTFEGAARGLAQSLGVGGIKLTDKYADSNSQLTVVLGTDYLQ